MMLALMSQLSDDLSNAKYRNTCANFTTYSYFQFCLTDGLFEATGYASEHIQCLSQARINWGGIVPGMASGVKMVEMAEVGAPISQDRVAVHLERDCGKDCQARKLNR